ncbi:MAG: rRNA pseudouridine synthase [Bdellovibrionaceae bacterium]|nr:rRNA pseudouridine synthase [Bdellovibrionales bacterium]MCB9083512.1 rRNA pseudouridine synthase [Pseudobdellovibrionaceae bacterium]
MGEEKLRLSKLMASQGICSRREADDLISKGCVRVDGETITELGTKVLPSAKVTLSQKGKDLLGKKVTIILNKPIGYLSSPSDDPYPLAQKLILPTNQDRRDRSRNRFSPYHLKGLASAGRLDIDSKGLLILTQDGVLAKKIIGQESRIDKEYLVRVEGDITKAKLETLRFGLSLDDKPLKRAGVKELEPCLLQFVLLEGRKRQIRRMCEAVDLKVVSLKRVRVGRLKLGPLKEGQWRYLGKKEQV